MKKIISILVALGVIVGMTLAAAPVAAIDCPADCTPPDLDDLLGPPDFCAGAQSVYQIGNVEGAGIGMTLPVTLIGGTDSLSVTFPVGTDLSSVDNTDIRIYSDFYSTGATVTNPTDVTITDNYLEFVVPVNGIFWLNIPAGTDIDITVSDVVNPPAGDYCLHGKIRNSGLSAFAFPDVQSGEFRSKIDRIIMSYFCNKNFNQHLRDRFIQFFENFQNFRIVFR